MELGRVLVRRMPRIRIRLVIGGAGWGKRDGIVHPIYEEQIIGKDPDEPGRLTRNVSGNVGTYQGQRAPLGEWWGFRAQLRKVSLNRAKCSSLIHNHKW